jgi:sortase A
MLRWIQRSLFAFAFVAFVYCAYVIAESWIFQRPEDRSLEQLVVAHQATITDTSPIRVQPGALVGRISVARLGVSVIVVEGTDGSTLSRAAGHISGTALPGQDGNVAIAAHRDTFFRPLRDIRNDDVITITTSHGDYRYRVVSTRVVSPDDVSVLNSDGNDVLTLVTCYPFRFIGAAPNRFIVRAEQIS